MNKQELIRSITPVMVMERLHIKPSDSEYLQTRQEVVQILGLVEERLHPSARFRRLQPMENTLILGEGTKQGAAMLVSLGAGVDELAAGLHDSGQVYQQYILELVLDLCLFQYSKAVFAEVEADLQRDGLCFTKILEPQQDLQEGQTAYLLKQLIFADYAVQKTEAGMLTPAKSMLFAYELGRWEQAGSLANQAAEGSGSASVGHDCSRCQLQECMFRTEECFLVSWEESGFTKQFRIKTGQSLRDALQEQTIAIQVPCAGRGVCKKCTIRLKSGKLHGVQVAGDDWLACVSYAASDIVIGPSGGGRPEKDIYVEGTKVPGRCKHSAAVRRLEATRVGIAIDIGSTTVAVNQIDLEYKGRPIRWQGLENPQRRFGADVISRIREATDGQAETLRTELVAAISRAIRQIYSESTEIQQAYMKGEQMRVAIGGNSTMIHLLLGYPCDALGQYPFTGHSFAAVNGRCAELLPNSGLGGSYYIFPALAAFVGGDITAGLYAEDFASAKQIRLLLDIGTNGEMVLGSADRMVACATAAGPVFEGGGIRCGMGALPGAIDHVWLEDGQVQFRTLGAEEPRGLCGTGLIDAVVVLRKLAIIDETGLLQEPYFTEGYPLTETVRLYQEDIRNLQMAKAAIGAGIKTLLAAYGISEQELSEVILAGGFGSKLSAENSRTLGLIPLSGVPIRSAGNLVLAGCIRYLMETDKAESLTNEADPASLLPQIKEMNLAMERGFQERYLEHMNL